MKTAILLCTFVGIAAMTAAGLVPADNIANNAVTSRQVSMGGVGECGKKFTEKKIAPVAICFCHVLFTGAVSVNVQERAESDCLDFFGSEEAILALEEPCVKFEKKGELDTKRLEKILNFIRRKCFPDEDFDVIFL